VLTVRFAAFNASLSRSFAGQLLADLSTPGDVQAQKAAEIIQRARPDVLLVNEFDYVAGGQAARLFQDHYLAVSQNGAEPIRYACSFVAPVNTGLPSGFDLNHDGLIGGPDDALGFGLFPGQYGMVVFSHYPIVSAAVRTFQRFLWQHMPGARLPADPATGAAWHSPAALAVLRLSSKSHWDLPMQIGDRVVHLLASHPTPPVFDGPERRNAARNFDEIRFWADYLLPAASGYIYDDNGQRGGLPPGALFVIAGDQNSDPLDGDSVPGAIQQLLEHPRVNAALTPRSAGAVEAAARLGGANLAHRGDPASDTAEFDPLGPGNLRTDYVLPSLGLAPQGGGVFWPASGDPLFHLVGSFPFPSSDHRLVWIDALVPRTKQQPIKGRSTGSTGH
jgi:hypothetical protein